METPTTRRRRPASEAPAANGGSPARAPKAAPQADALRRPVAGGLHAAADAITQASQRLWANRKISEGIADVGQGVADGLESSASYLETHDAAQIAGDALALARRYPLQTMLVAGVIGFACGWFARPSVRPQRPLAAASHSRRGRTTRR